MGILLQNQGFGLSISSEAKESRSAGDLHMEKPGNFKRFYRRICSSSLLAYLLSLMGSWAYIIQSWKDIHIQTSLVDEGIYLYLGSLYARGLLRPFQDFGPRSIYAPLSLLVPGSIQAWFGGGLLTGRLFSLFLGILTLVGLWLVAHRLSGKWGAALAVCVVALTPAQIMIYSSALSEVLVACMLVWVLVFTLGEKRTNLQIIAGSILAGLIVMTRQNMIPLVPILVAYVFWQHGKKAGFLCLAMSLAPIAILHVLYWPNILILWERWFPSRLTPFLDRFRPIGEPIWAGIKIPILTRINALLQGLLFNYIPVLGALFAIVLWPGKKDWKNEAGRRASVFLAVLFWILFFAHAYVITLENSTDLCTYCLTPYLSFFNVLGLLLVCSSLPYWRKIVSRTTQVGITVLILILGCGLGYARFERFGTWLLAIEFPSIQKGLPHTWYPGFTIPQVLWDKFHVDYWPARDYVPTVAGLIIGVLMIGLAFIIHKRISKKGNAGIYSFGSTLLLVALFSGSIISPITQGDYREEGLCSTDIPNNYEAIGEELNKIIPPGSQVFWEVSNAVPLLYAPEINIYPAQIIGGSSYRNAEDSQELLRLGYWNDSVRAQWVEKADYLVIQPNPLASYSIPPLEIDPTLYRITQLPALDPCNPNSFLLVYERK
jgi:hypothetical protein